MRPLSANNPLRTALIAATLAFGAATSVWQSSQTVAAEITPAAFQTITPGDLAQMLTHKDFVLVNVHIPYEGEIAQTDAFIPYDQIGAQLSKLPPDKAAKIVLYCRSGRMSEIAATTLASLGFTHVSHLGGGMNAWEAAGQPLLRK